MTAIITPRHPNLRNVDQKKLVTAMRVLADTKYAEALANGKPRQAKVLKHGIEQAVAGNKTLLKQATNFRWIPPDIDTFLDDPDFLGDKFTIWEPLRADLRLINPDVWTGAEACYEANLGGATNTGKTALQIVSALYQTTCLTCLHKPQQHWNFSPGTGLIYPLQSYTIRANNETKVFYSRHASYEVAPPEKYSGVKFRVLVGTEDYSTKILRDDEVAPPNADVREVPVEFKPTFVSDPERALRDIIGVATAALEPFITRRDSIPAAMELGAAAGLRPWFKWRRGEEIVDLTADGLPEVDEANLPDKATRALPHYVHVDLSKTTDRCGIAFVRQDGFAIVEQATGASDRLPKFVVALAMAIQPSKICPLDYRALRAWIMRFGSVHGVNVVAVTFDGYQSLDSVQLMRKSGVRSWEQSVDRTMEPYEYLRSSIYQGRVALPESEVLRVELVQLENVKAKNKVDHPPTGSKDLADAVCGAVFLASRTGAARAGSGMVGADGDVDLRAGRQRPQGRLRSTRTRPGSARAIAEADGRLEEAAEEAPRRSLLVPVNFGNMGRKGSWDPLG